MGQTGKKPSTTSFLRKIINTNDINKIIMENQSVFVEENFSQYLQKLCEERELIAERVILQAGIDRTYGHQLFNGTRNPSRDKVLQLAVGMHLTIEETQKLLLYAGKSSLYAKVERDAVVIFALEKKMEIIELQLLLQSLELPELGGC